MLQNEFVRRIQEPYAIERSFSDSIYCLKIGLYFLKKLVLDMAKFTEFDIE